jgi:ribosomal protein S17
VKRLQSEKVTVGSGKAKRTVIVIRRELSEIEKMERLVKQMEQLQNKAKGSAE